jgi:hypothetical protein
MTLEEMGRDYLRQAEEMEPRIEEKRKDIQAHANDSNYNLAKENQNLALLESIHYDLLVTGYKLINYYR